MSINDENEKKNKQPIFVKIVRYKYYKIFSFFIFLQNGLFPFSLLRCFYFLSFELFLSTHRNQFWFSTYMYVSVESMFVAMRKNRKNNR